MQALYNNIYYRKYHNIEKIQYDVVKRPPNLKKIFNKDKIVELKPKPLLKDYSMIGFPAVSTVKFLPSYSPVRNIGIKCCPACQEINYIIEQEIKSKTHYVRDNQILKIKAGQYLRSSEPLTSTIKLRPISSVHNNSTNFQSNSLLYSVQNPLSSRTMPLIPKTQKVPSLEAIISSRSQQKKIEYRNNKDNKIPQEQDVDIYNFIHSNNPNDNFDDELFIRSISNFSNLKSNAENNQENNQENNAYPNLDNVNSNIVDNKDKVIDNLLSDENQLNNFRQLRSTLENLDKKYGFINIEMGHKTSKSISKSLNKKLGCFMLKNNDFYYSKVKKIGKDKAKITK